MAEIFDFISNDHKALWFNLLLSLSLFILINLEMYKQKLTYSKRLPFFHHFTYSRFIRIFGHLVSYLRNEPIGPLPCPSLLHWLDAWPRSKFSLWKGKTVDHLLFLLILRSFVQRAPIPLHFLLVFPNLCLGRFASIKLISSWWFFAGLWLTLSISPYRLLLLIYT